MIHNMNLRQGPYNTIKSGTKKIEMCLYDEKRQKIRVGDYIEFTNEDKTDTCTKRVVGLHIYDSFERLYQLFDKVLLGYQSDEPAHYSDMLNYYPKAEIDQYGVVGIELE